MQAIVILKLILQQSRQGFMALAAAVMLGIFGTGALAYGLQSQQELPSLPASAAGNVASTAAPIPIAAGNTSTQPPALDFSRPVHLSIPAINVDSDLITVGKNADGTIEVPSGDQHDLAAWYKHSPAPGQFGASVIEGHVDSRKNGPSVFFKLGDLRPDDTIHVTRADGTTVIFRVDGVREYDKDAFPTELVYGPVEGAALRLITCSGEFNKSTAQYNKNIVVFAKLVETRPPQT